MHTRHSLAALCLVLLASGCPSGGGFLGDLAMPPKGDGGTGCTADTMCSGSTPRCDTSTGKCVACLPDKDNCGIGKHCIDMNGTWTCSSACRNDTDCTKGTCCAGVCIDTTVDVKNCGACDKTCDAPANTSVTCSGGACMSGGCKTGFTDCDNLTGNGCEVATGTDIANCGACGRTCAAPNGTPSCQTGVCTIASCNAGFADCDKNATNGCEAALGSDVKNCGGCGNACPTVANGTAACTASSCGVGACNAGFADCDKNATNGCETDLNNVASCGACGNVCPKPSNAAAACTNMTCGLGACDPLFGNCDGNAPNGCELPLAGDIKNCGACGKTCSYPSAAALCTGGACALGTCNAGFGNCDGNAQNGCETGLLSNVAHCGACGNACPAVANGSPGCAGGACGLGACNAGFASCDGNAQNGCEVSLTTLQNCGACGNVCPTPAHATAACTSMTCGIAACDTLYANCDGNVTNGCETSLGTDTKNCGACGAACVYANAGALCNGGACALGTCTTGFANCDNIAQNGCEARLATDNNNCGVCGTVCGTGTSCTSGSCSSVAPKVLVVGADVASPNADVRAKLFATGAFTSVDVFQADTGTPTVSQLQAYDAVLVYSNYPFADATALGNNLADYWDGGGRVVVAVFANAATGNYSVLGRFGTIANGYMLISPMGTTGTAASLGTIFEPQSPLVAGVNTLSATSAYRSTGGVVNGGIVVAQWTVGSPLIVRGVVKGRNRVDLNLFPPSATAQSGGWTGDGAILMKNALLYK